MKIQEKSKKRQEASNDSNRNSNSTWLLMSQVGINSVKNKKLSPDYLDGFSYHILTMSQLKNDLVSEIILILIPCSERKIKKQKY